MRVIQFAISFVLLILLLWVLNRSFGNVPPIGKFLDPTQGFWSNGEPQSGPQFQDIISLNGLKEDVEVFYDNRYVPHIYARNSNDLYFVQGYVMAMFRLWQMELYTRAASGRLSEVFGEKTLDTDRLNRRLGMVLGAQKRLEHINRDPGTKNMLESFTNGINAYIYNLGLADFPVEYKFFNHIPEYWEPINTCYLFMNMSKTLSGIETDIEKTNSKQILGNELYQFLFKDHWETEDPIIPKGIYKPLESDALSLSDDGDIDALYSIDREKEDYIPGSNNWAIHKSKTENNNNLLANDPHLKMTLPSIWFENHLISPGMNVYGVSLPGSPGVIIGFNDSIAWGVTNGGRDVRDWYEIEFKDESRDAYILNNTFKDTEYIVEKIPVKNKGYFIDTVVYSVFGPVTYDRTFQLDGLNGLANSWTAHDGANELLTFYNLNTANNIDDYYNALTNFDCPAQNFVFADKKGNVAIQQQGKFPIRKTADLIQDGRTSATLWNEYIPQLDITTVRNPKRGFVSSANQIPADSNYKYQLPGKYEHFRNERINTVLNQWDDIDMDKLKQLQLDNYNLLASKALPIMLTNIKTSNLNTKGQQYLKILNRWNYFNEASLVGPTLFESWWKILYLQFWDQLTNKNESVAIPDEHSTIHLWMNIEQFYGMNEIIVKSEEAFSNIITACFYEMVDEMDQHSEEFGDLQWFNYKQTTIQHLGRIPSFGTSILPVGGNKHIVNAIGKEAGPSWRMIVEMGDKIRAQGIYPGGQSGNPGSFYYDSQIKDWVVGDYYNLLHSNDYNLLKTNSISTQQFYPQEQ